MRCPWADDVADAKRVAVQLGISFKVYDFQTEYRSAVVGYMLREYQAGRTPNPDIMCNQEVKFKLFLESALADGAEMIATGHYAARVSAQSLEARVKSQEETHDSLCRAKDEKKDQTYFLYRITSEALSKTLFPLGDYLKSEVREMAAARGLVTARKKDSQGICFVGSVGIKEFLSQYISAQSGNVIDKDTGVVVGRHDGAIYYTLGQRHGLGLGGGLPYYVTGKDMAANILYVSRNLNDASMWRSRMELGDVHWINDPPVEGDILAVRMRHGGKLISCTLTGTVLELSDPERSVPAGQSAVIYRGQECLGGGIITG